MRTELPYNSSMQTNKKDMSDSEVILTRKELAKRWKVAPDTITRWAK